MGSEMCIRDRPRGVPSTSGNSATGGPPEEDGQNEKNGGFNQANKEFDNLGLTNIRDIPNIGRVGQLKDGTKVVVRNKSSDGRSTLEIQSSPKKIEIRYNP